MADDKRYIFIVDDEPIQNEMLKDYLSERFTYDIKVFETGEAAVDHLHLNPEIIILDYHLSGKEKAAKNGLEILKTIKQRSPNVQVIILSGQDRIDVAVDSMRNGAYDYVVKGETAFSRTENVINNISELHKMHTINVAQRRTITLLLIVLIVIIILAILYGIFGLTTPRGRVLFS